MRHAMSSHHPPLRFGSITTTINGAEVEGVITDAGPFDVEVELVAPHRGWFLRREVGRVWREPVQWYESEHIEQVAHELLTALYHTAMLVTERRPRLVEAYRQLRRDFVGAWEDVQERFQAKEFELLNQRPKGWVHALYVSRASSERLRQVKAPLSELYTRHDREKFFFIDEHLPELLEGGSTEQVDIAKVLDGAELMVLRKEVFRRLAVWAASSSD